MINRKLSSFNSIVNNNTIPLFQTLKLSTFLGHIQKMPQQFHIILLCILQLGYMEARNDEEVNGSLGIDVEKCHTFFILVNELCGYFLVEYLGEYCVTTFISVLLLCCFKEARVGLL